MARRESRPTASDQREFATARRQCWACAVPLWVTYSGVRTVATLDGLIQFRVQVRRCEQASCPQFHRPYHAEAEGAMVLPHGECGLERYRSGEPCAFRIVDVPVCANTIGQMVNKGQHKFVPVFFHRSFRLIPTFRPQVRQSTVRGDMVHPDCYRAVWDNRADAKVLDAAGHHPLRSYLTDC